MGESRFRCTGIWNGEKFERVIEAEDESDARDHWLYWALIGNASLENLEVNRVVH